MSDYSLPTTEDIREWCGDAFSSDENDHQGFGIGTGHFDRWLTAHDREVAARAWDKGYSEAVDFERGWLHAVKSGGTVPPKPTNPYLDQEDQ